MTTIWRMLAVLGGLILAALWCFGSGLLLGLRECPVEGGSGLCAPGHEDLLAALEVAIVMSGTMISLAGGVLSALTRRPQWLAGAVVLLGGLGLCGEVVAAGQEPPPS
jgi:hypothetical protein